jgi:hypothetical protein
MENLIRFLGNYEGLIYGTLGLAALLYLRKIVQAWRELTISVFGLEKESAQKKINSALTVLIILAVFGLSEFGVVTFIAPTIPQIDQNSTPTLDVLATPTATLSLFGGTLAPTLNAAVVSNLASTPAVISKGCVPGQLEWTYPKAGQEVSGTLTLQGTVNTANFGFYKYEYAAPGGENWITIAAGNQLRLHEDLGIWNTKTMPRGDYRLRLVVNDNQNKVLPACEISIKIVAP